MAKASSNLDDKAAQYRLHFNPDKYSAVENLYKWIEEESLRLLKSTKGKTQEETFAIVNQASGIIKVKEHIEQLKTVANPNE